MIIESEFNYGEKVFHKLLPDKHYIVNGFVMRDNCNINVEAYCFNQDGAAVNVCFYENEIELVKENKIGFNRK